MAVQQAYKGQIELAFDYKQTENSAVQRYTIEPERISYLMIDRKYENVNILPVVYISVNLRSDMYSNVVNSTETSKFHLKVKKRNALSDTSVWVTEIDDSFSYVTSSQAANYSQELANTQTAEDTSYRGIMIGLVSVNMTNSLRKSFNGVYRNTKISNLVKMGLEGLPNLIMQDLTYDNNYASYLVPPLTTRYKLLQYLFDQDPFYDSNFTFFMDFDKTYMISKNAKAVSGKDGNPSTAIINIKSYTAKEAYTDGFTISNGAYLIYVNASDTNITINNATEKVAKNIIAYSNSTGIQNLTTEVNSSDTSANNKTYVVNNNAAAMKNELQSNAVTIELIKQNVDPDIFTPNKCFNVINYDDYRKYDGQYFLSYKREFFYITQSGEFIVTCNVGLKKTEQEEKAQSKKDTYNVQKVSASTSSKAKKSSSATKKNTSTKATR